MVSGNGDLSMAEKWERWTREEIAILRRCYSNMPRADLMQLLPGRTWCAIYHIAEKQKLHRNWRDIPLSEEEIVALHTRLSIARGNRTGAPFAGKHHSAEGKLHLSVGILHAFGHSIAAIAKRNGIAEKEVKKIIEEREERSNRKK